MEPLPAIPETFQPKFDQMWRSACRVCDNILDFQPDLLLALMHSGWGPVFAAQNLWQHTQALPFPSIARTNVGSEKIRIFDGTFNSLTSFYFVGHFSDDIDIGKVLAWATTRVDWHAQLRQQIVEAMLKNDPPQRILVVDDTIHEGRTYILILGLLATIYPQAEVRFLNADSWYRSEYSDLLLASVYPASELFPDGKIPSDEVKDQLVDVAIGSEDVSEDSLSWQTASLDSPSVQALSVYRPAADWVRASEQVYAIIARDITEHAASYIPKEINSCGFQTGLSIKWCLMRDIWLENGITRRQAEQRYALSSQDVNKIFGEWIDDDRLLIEGYGRWTRYVIPLALQRYVSGDGEDPRFAHEEYWLLPGELMFGSRSWYLEGQKDVEWARENMRELLAIGIDCFLDVQIIREGGSPKENLLFLEEAKAIGRTAIAQAVPLSILYVNENNRVLTRRGRPNRKDILPILDTIDQFLLDGRVLYVSVPDRDLRGILAGCYLARHGQSGRAALQTLQACRATGLNGWKLEPVAPNARRYVRSWPTGL